MAIVTKADLINLSRSTNPAERQRAFDIYQAWLAASSQLDPADRLGAIDRLMLDQAFATSSKKETSKNTASVAAPSQTSR